jgi:hypothetical protein
MGKGLNMVKGAIVVGGASGLISEVSTITPEVAAKWLATSNKKNRKLSIKKVKRIASSITKGLWRVTHQGIAFYDNDELADGQHRLAAIVMAGVPVQVMVTYGLPVEVHDSIDKGQARTLNHNMDFLGKHQSRNAMAVYRAMYSELDRQTRKADCWGSACYEVELPEFVAVQAKYEDAVVFAMSVRQHRKIAICEVYAAVAAASFSHSKERLEEFLNVLASGVATKASDTAAIRLREYLLSHVLHKGIPSRFDTYVRCCTAIDAFLEHRGLSKLYARPDATFELPPV